MHNDTRTISTPASLANHLLSSRAYSTIDSFEADEIKEYLEEMKRLRQNIIKIIKARNESLFIENRNSTQANDTSHLIVKENLEQCLLRFKQTDERLIKSNNKIWQTSKLHGCRGSIARLLIATGELNLLKELITLNFFSANTAFISVWNELYDQQKSGVISWDTITFWKQYPIEIPINDLPACINQICEETDFDSLANVLYSLAHVDVLAEAYIEHYVRFRSINTLKFLCEQGASTYRPEIDPSSPQNQISNNWLSDCILKNIHTMSSERLSVADRVIMTIMKILHQCQHDMLSIYNDLMVYMTKKLPLSMLYLYQLAITTKAPISYSSTFGYIAEDNIDMIQHYYDVDSKFLEVYFNEKRGYNFYNRVLCMLLMPKPVSTVNLEYIVRPYIQHDQYQLLRSKPSREYERLNELAYDEFAINLLHISLGHTANQFLFDYAIRQTEFKNRINEPLSLYTKRSALSFIHGNHIKLSDDDLNACEISYLHLAILYAPTYIARLVAAGCNPNNYRKMPLHNDYIMELDYLSYTILFARQNIVEILQHQTTHIVDPYPLFELLSQDRDSKPLAIQLAHRLPNINQKTSVFLNYSLLEYALLLEYYDYKSKRSKIDYDFLEQLQRLGAELDTSYYTALDHRSKEPEGAIMTMLAFNDPTLFTEFANRFISKDPAKKAIAARKMFELSLYKSHTNILNLYRRDNQFNLNGIKTSAILVEQQVSLDASLRFNIVVEQICKLFPDLNIAQQKIYSKKFNAFSRHI